MRCGPHGSASFSVSSPELPTLSPRLSRRWVEHRQSLTQAQFVLPMSRERPRFRACLGRIACGNDIDRMQIDAARPVGDDFDQPPHFKGFPALTAALAPVSRNPIGLENALHYAPP